MLQGEDVSNEQGTSACGSALSVLVCMCVHARTDKVPDGPSVRQCCCVRRVEAFLSMLLQGRKARTAHWSDAYEIIDAEQILCLPANTILRVQPDRGNAVYHPSTHLHGRVAILQSHMLLIWSMSLVKSVILVELNYVADFGGRKCSSHDHMWPSGEAF